MAMDGKKFNFTKAAIEALPIGTSLAKYMDSTTRGLALWVNPGGVKTFYYHRRWAGTLHGYKIGSWPDLTVSKAREIAEAHNAAYALGQDPRSKASPSKKEMTFREFGQWWIEEYAKKKGKASWDLDEWMLNAYFGPIANVRIGAITKQDMFNLHVKISERHGKYAGNRAMELARSMYNRAAKRDIFTGENPVTGVEWNEKKSRDRRLMPGEVAAFFDALEKEPSEDMRDFFLLSLFTAARQANVLAMRWDEIDFTGRQWRIPLSKNGEPVRVPLEDQEMEILRRRKQNSQSEWVFPTRSATGHMVEPKMGWRRIVKRAGLSDLRPHDLRRTMASWCADNGASLEQIGKLLGQKSFAATQIYARVSVERLRVHKAKGINDLLSYRTPAS